ncbi:BTAD domain-containing putative transcriptional regulator [Streptomyces sp. NPDC102402]|uniref:AfsR/SARP family transcriptional regulator n=1 Tax=Streptomyces sp. NPDC102402 TaxID=3366169 RepID=UPI0037F5FF9D
MNDTVEHEAPADPGHGPVGFRILGPVEVHDPRTGERAVPSGPKQSALLGALAARPGQLLAVDRLVDELWGDTPPAAPANALQAHVARLRRLLPGGGEPEWITTRPPGYLLWLGRATTDAQCFHRLAAEGRAAAAAEPALAVTVLRRALALWRGPALEGSVRGAICAAEADRLEEQRLTVLEVLYEASLRSGPAEHVVFELERLAAEHPVRERFHDLLMVALCRAGRPTEALGVYERACRRLADGLGVGPGPALRSRMEAILHQAPLTAMEFSAPPAAFGADGALLDLGSELARLRSRVDTLTQQQEDLLRHIHRLAGGPTLV